MAKMLARMIQRGAITIEDVERDYPQYLEAVKEILGL